MYRIGLVALTASPAPALAPPTFEEDPGFVCAIEVQPELIGLAGLHSGVVYPEATRRDRVEGRVFVQFIVTEEGEVEDPVAIRSPDPRLSVAAIHAVRASRFVPGSQRGRPVKVRFAVPVTFRLGDAPSGDG